MEGGNDNEFHDGDEMIYDIVCVDNELECERVRFCGASLPMPKSNRPPENTHCQYHYYTNLII